MSASLGPSWNLRSNASPRCLTAFVTKTSRGSNSDGGGGVNVADGSISVTSSNPFDDDVRTSWSGETKSLAAQPGLNFVYSVVFGTERGSLHYRAYPASESTHDDAGNQRSAGRTYERSVRDPSQTVISPLSATNGTGDGSSSVVSSSLSVAGASASQNFGPINLQGAVKGVIVGIIRARPQLSHDLASDAAASSGNEIEEPPPVFLVLVDDNKGSSGPSSVNPGAFATYLVTVKHGSFGKLPPAPPHLDFSSLSTGEWHNGPPENIQPTARTPASFAATGADKGAGGTSGSSNWFGAENKNSRNVISSHGPSHPVSSTNASVSSSSSATSLGTLPRMSCATYHPKAGFVYSAGTGVYGLPATAVKAVLAGMTRDYGHYSSARGQGGGSSSGVSRNHPSMVTSNASVQSRRGVASASKPPAYSSSSPLPPMALYLKCQNALPQPGVRPGGSKNAMTLSCCGRVAIVAVTNAFYAVPACLDLTAASLSSKKNSYRKSADNRQPAVGNNLPPVLRSISATKLLAFAQSSQVHPVIAMEVMVSADRPADFASDNYSPAGVACWLRPITSLVVLACGRECTAVEIVSIPDAHALTGLGNSSRMTGGGIVPTSIKSTPPRQGIATLPSPILAAAALPSSLNEMQNSRDTSRGGVSGTNNRNPRGNISSGPLIALLTVDGLVHIRSPFCVAVPLASIEVGTRPNDFFSLSSLPSSKSLTRKIVATSYNGVARLMSCNLETPQDFADRLMKLSIDAFGSNGFPRLELAGALGATFSATSYAGPSEPTAHRRSLLRQYLESVLGLADDIGAFLGNTNGSVSWAMSEDGPHGDLDFEDMLLGIGEQSVDGSSGGSRNLTMSASIGPDALLTGTALLCLVCFQLSPPMATLANRASKACASEMGIVRPKDSNISKATVAVCEQVADRLLKEVSASFSLLHTSSSAPISSSNRFSQLGTNMEFVEAAVWLLRSCGCHEKAIFVLQERINVPSLRNASVGGGSGPIPQGGGSNWSQIKFDSYIATHLSELWSSKNDKCCELVLLSEATRELLLRNPTLGLSIFTTLHPQNEKEWEALDPADDPLAHPFYPLKVVELLKSVSPRSTPYDINVAEGSSVDFPQISATFSLSYQAGEIPSAPLPLYSGRALAVTYLESAIGVATGRPSLFPDETSLRPDQHDESDERKADMHDELSYLLLEGVISERGDGDDGGSDSNLGAIYRYKLRRLLNWPHAKIRSERLLASLPSSFLREHALLLGRLGRHEDALRIFYSDLNSLELALEYCDARHERQQAQIIEESTASADMPTKKLIRQECAYLPLVSVVLNSDPDSDRGTAAAIQVLALRRDSIDKGAALRLLPKHVPMSSVVRPFLIPAIVENESHVRRLTVAASLLRARYVQLKHKLTNAQLKSQASLHVVPALQKFNLGDLLQSSKAIKARPVHASSPSLPDVAIIKHIFPRYLVIQAQVSNNGSHPQIRTLADVAFVVAESSDEALSPTTEVPLRTLPPKATGSAWCVLAASPQRLDGTAFLTCELRYTVLSVDAATGAPLNFSSEAITPGFGQAFVEELQDIEVHHTEFSLM